jgi:hypothetical protein
MQTLHLTWRRHGASGFSALPTAGAGDSVVRRQWLFQDVGVAPWPASSAGRRRLAFMALTLEQFGIDRLKAYPDNPIRP